MDLKKLRVESNHTQLDIAKYCEVSLNAYANWERGANKPNEENLAKLKRFFGIKERNNG